MYFERIIVDKEAWVKISLATQIYLYQLLYFVPQESDKEDKGSKYHLPYDYSLKVPYEDSVFEFPVTT